MKTRLGVLAAALLAAGPWASPLLSQEVALQAGSPDKDHAADRAAIRAAGQSFLKAYTAGDARALAAHWTAQGEYLADDGTILRGRGSIEKAYAELFDKKAGATRAEIETTSLRFPSRDTAIEEGYFKMQTGKEAPVTSKYSILHVRDDGKWLMAVVREWPREGASLRDLDWLIGAWTARRGETEVRTTYEWWGEKSFIRVTITVQNEGRTRTGFQMIGKDRATGQIRSWTFDPAGSFAEATWTRDGKKWVQESAAVLENGTTVSATNLLTRIDDNAFTFQSVQRSENGEPIADIPPVRVTRVKGK